MIVILEQSLEEKEIRKLNCLWGVLCKKKQYFLPKTIKDLEEAALNTEIKIDGIKHFFTDELKKNFRNFIDTIFYHSTITEYFCYNTIYQSVLSELEKTVNSDNTKNTMEFHLAEISNSLNEKLAKREFYFLLSGLKLKGSDHLMLDDMQIFDFKESHLTKIIKNRIPTSVDDDFDKDISDFVKENFSEKLV